MKAGPSRYEVLAARTSVTAFLIALVFMAMIFWEALFPYQYFKTQPVWPLDKSEYVAGEEVFAYVEYEKTTELPADIGLMMTGMSDEGKPRLFVFPRVAGAFHAGSGKAYVSVVTLPAYTPPGKYRVHITIWYHKSFRVVTHEYVTEAFTVKRR